MPEPTSTPRRTLFDLSQELHDLYDHLEALEGDVTDPDVERAIDAWFDRLGKKREEHLDNYAALIRELEARAEARREEARRLADRARRDAGRADYLKHRLVSFLQEHGLKTVETRRYRLTVARSGGKPPVLLKAEPEQLPPEFQRVTVDADLTAIRDVLERGESLSFAELGERGHYLRIS